MDLTYPDDAESFRLEIRAWLEANLPAGWFEPGFSLTSAERQSFNQTWNETLFSGGWICAGWPVDYGGKGLSLLQQVVLNEEFARAGAPMRADFFGDTLVGPTILQWGTEEQKKEFIPGILHGSITWCQGFSEPGSGSDLASLQTRAIRDGDSYVVNGQKIWTSNAQRADYMILLARTDPDAPKHRGISYFLLDMKLPGVTIRPLMQMTGQAGFNEVYFDDVRIPANRVVGELNRGWYVSTATLDFERSGIGRVIGGLHTYHDVVDYAKRTPSRNGGGSLFDVNSIRHQLADVGLSFAVGRLLSYRVAWMQSKSMVPNYEASIAKVFGTELHQRLARVAMTTLGMPGQLMEGPNAPLDGAGAALYLSSVSVTVAAGTSEVNRNIIAQRGLGMPRG